MNVWGPQLYLLEQHGFRRIVSTTFMMAFMFPRHVDQETSSGICVHGEGTSRYRCATRAVQALLHQRDSRALSRQGRRSAFGVGERVVPLPYTRAMFEKTQAWMQARNLFDAAPDTGVSYEQAVDS